MRAAVTSISDPPQWGPLVTEKFHGRRKDRQKGWIDVVIELTYPDYCMVTVYRLIGGARRPLASPSSGRRLTGGLEARRSRMRCGKKRPHGQLHKVAKAASLRAAFPEEGDTTAEEMEGQTIEPPPPAPVPADNWKPPEPPQNEGPPRRPGARPRPRNRRGRAARCGTWG